MVAFQIKCCSVRDSNHLSAIYVKYVSLKEVMNAISLRLEDCWDVKCSRNEVRRGHYSQASGLPPPLTRLPRRASPLCRRQGIECAKSK